MVPIFESLVVRAKVMDFDDDFYELYAISNTMNSINKVYYI